MPFHKKVITVMPVFLLGLCFVVFVYFSSLLSRPAPSLLYDKMDYALLETISNRLSLSRLNTAEILPYTGGKDDDAYLRDYIVALASSLYDVSEDMFDRPTLASTSLLRDMVHKFNYQRAGVRSEKKVAGAQDRHDCAAMWRYRVRGACGMMSYALFEIYKSLGYATNRIDLLNGPWGKRRQGKSYSRSHVTTEVYLDDYQKFVVQDPTYNLLMTDDDGNALSLLETRQRHFQTGKPYKFLHFTIGIKRPAYPGGVAEHIDDVIQNEWPFFIVKRETYRAGKVKILDVRHLKKKTSNHETLGRADVAGVIRRLCRKKRFQTCIQRLGRLYDVSGYMFFAPDTQQEIATYIQIGVEEGYVSVDYTTKQIYTGEHAEMLKAYAQGGVENKDLIPLDRVLSPVSYLDHKGRLLKWVF